MTLPAAADDPAHRYLSTACLHGRHDYCNAMVGYQGVKRPAQCKWCSANCECPRHTNPDAPCVGDDKEAARPPCHEGKMTGPQPSVG